MFFSFQCWQKAGPVKDSVGEPSRACQFTQCWHHIQSENEFPTRLSPLRVTGPANNAWHSCSAIVDGPIFGGQRPGGTVRVHAGNCGSIVAGDKHERVLSKVQFLRTIQYGAHSGIQLANVAVMCGMAGIVRRVHVGVLVSRSDQFMWFVKTRRP